MKNKYLYRIAASVALLVFLLAGFNIQLSAQYQDDKLIIGTWISDNGGDWKLTFKNDGKCYENYGGTAETYFYTVSNSSPQCGREVPVNVNTSYLRTINIQDSDTVCYQIYGLTDKHLSISPFGYGNPTVFDRVIEGICDISSPNYNCTQCQQLRITPGSAVYDQNIAQIVGFMQQGAYEQAAQVIAGMSDYLIWQDVNYEFFYDAGTNDFDYNNADPSNIYVTIGTFFNANVYHGTLCRDLYHKLLLTLIDKGDDMPEYKFWARCESIFADESPAMPQASPRAIKAWYLEAVQLYNTIPSYYRSQFTPLYDRLVAFYNANKAILDNPPAEW